MNRHQHHGMDDVARTVDPQLYMSLPQVYKGG